MKLIIHDLPEDMAKTFLITLLTIKLFLAALISPLVWAVLAVG